VIQVKPGADWVFCKECWRVHYFIAPNGIGRSDLNLYEFATGKKRKILTIGQPVRSHITD